MSFVVSDKQIVQFDSDGFIVVKQLFHQDEINGLLKLAKSDQFLLHQAHVKRDSAGAATKLTVRNELADSPYSAIVRCQRVAENMARLLRDEIYHYHHKMMLKEPRVGGAWEWHQDYGYWYNNGCLFPDMASCLIAIDRASRANGCLQVLRGSQKLGRIDHVPMGDQTGADPTRIRAALERFDLVYCELQPGDAIFFHSNLLHCSAQNLSDHPRWSLICCYNTRHNDPIITGGRHPNYQPLEIWPDSKVRQLLTAELRQSDAG